MYPYPPPILYPGGGQRVESGGGSLLYKHVTFFDKVTLLYKQITFFQGLPPYKKITRFNNITNMVTSPLW